MIQLGNVPVAEDQANVLQQHQQMKKNKQRTLRRMQKILPHPNNHKNLRSIFNSLPAQHLPRHYHPVLF